MTAPTRHGVPAPRAGPDPGERFGVAAPGGGAARGAVAGTAPGSPAGVSAHARSAGAAERPGRWRRLARWQRALILLCTGLALPAAGFLGGWVVMTPDTVRALRLAHGVHAGASLSDSDLETVTVPADTGGVLPAERAGSVVGRTARTTLPAGALLRPGQLTDREGAPGSGKTLVGLALEPGRLPAGGLVAGDSVAVVVPTSSSGQGRVRPEVVIRQAPVWRVRAHGGTLAVTLLVPGDRAAKLAASASAKPVSLVRLGGR